MATNIESCDIRSDETRETRQGVNITETYVITVSDSMPPTHRTSRIKLSGCLPTRWDQHDVISSAYVSNVDIRENPKEEAGPTKHFLATVTYDTPTFEPLASGSTDPLDQPADISWDSVARRVVIYLDKNGDPVRNSARDWFDPPIEEERNYPRVTITRNEATYDVDEANAYRDSVNADSLTIAGLTVSARQAKITSFDGAFRQQDGDIYYSVRYVIEFKPGKGWVQEPVDQGYRAFDASGNKSRIVESEKTSGYVIGLENGQPVDEPVRLDGSGGILGKTASLSSTVFGEFHTRDELQFWQLGLPSTMPSD